MEKPNFEEIIKRLEEHSQNLKENSQIGNSKLILAFAEMIAVMGWQSSQQDTNNIQIANLIGETKNLKDIADQNANTSRVDAKSSKRIAIAAFIVAAISLLVIILQTPISYQHECNYTGTPALKNQTVECQSELRIGAYDFNWGDQGYHAVRY